MEIRDQQLVSFATLGFFTFSLIHNLANQFTQLQFTVEEARKYLPPETHRQLDHTTQYLSSVLRDSQAMLGRTATGPMWFDLESAILESLELSKFDCFLQKVCVTTALKKTFIQGNRVAFLQIMLNLLKNGIQATSVADTKTIDIVLQKKRHSIVVTVHDSGPGLVQQKPRLDEVTSGRIQGLGILYIQQQMQASFCGGFTLENSPTGAGCLATLTFPLPRTRHSSKASPERQKPGRIE